MVKKNHLLLRHIGIGMMALLSATVSANSEYYESVRSVDHGLDHSFFKMLQGCGAEAPLIMGLETDAEMKGELTEEAVNAFLRSNGYFGETVLYCLEIRIAEYQASVDKGS